MKFQCKKCGQCCQQYTIPVKDTIHQDQIEFLTVAKGYEYFETPIGPFLRRNERCPQLRYDNTCAIYDKRPLICKNHTC